MSPIPVSLPFLGEDEAAAMAAVVASGWVAQGPRVAEFERAFAARVGVEHAVAVSSCTTGLHLALLLVGVAAGDEVIVPSLSFIATANAVRYSGANPVFADIDEATLNLTVGTIARVVTPATKAVIVVHQAGIPADLDAIHAFCDPRAIAVIEDSACAAGSSYQGRPIGGGPVGVFSFHPRKVITTGEGGMLTTDNEAWAARARRLREHGMNMSAADRHASASPVIERYLETGFNYRMTDIQAALGLVQVGRLDDLVARRRELAHRYQEAFADVAGLQTATDPAYGTTNFQSFWVMLSDAVPVGRDELLHVLADNGVSARRGIMAAHLEPAYAAETPTCLPVTERVTANSLILPLFHQLTEAQQDHVIEVVRHAVGAKR